MRLIDADMIIAKLETVEQNNELSATEANRLGWLKEMFQMTPTIEAEPVRHGRWIEDRLVTTNGGTYGVRRCSLCEAYYQDVGYGWDYCPECGARMDGDDNA